MAKKFQRQIEDFVCSTCGAEVDGDGYTDHCSACLWSKHVDINPGDRASACLGMMEPIAVEGASPRYTIVYRCTKCDHAHLVKAHARDHVDAIIALARAHADRI